MFLGEQIFQMKIWKYFPYSFRGKSNFVKICALYKACDFAKSVLLIICGKNLTDECIGNSFLTDAFASIASAWIRPWGGGG